MAQVWTTFARDVHIEGAKTTLVEGLIMDRPGYFSNRTLIVKSLPGGHKLHGKQNRLFVMSKYIYDYAEWLNGHATRKTMMQKLERSLVPYQLFQSIELKNDRQPRSGEVTIDQNTYHYDVTYDYRCIGHDVYDAVISIVDIKDRWQNLLMGYNKFKVVMDGNRVKTIYADHEDFFQQVIDMFEQEDYAGLYANRCKYINNLLARYILLRLLEAHRPHLQLLTNIQTEELGNIPVLAADANRNEMYLYAFSKFQAREMATLLDGVCRNLTIIYFFNQDFEVEGNTVGFDSGCTRIMSARAFMQNLPLDTMERRLIERRMLMLVSLLYNEHIDWNFNRVEHVVSNPPMYLKFIKEQKKKQKSKKGKKTKKAKQPKVQPGIPWYQRIYRTLLEDALNVLEDQPRTHSDIFHYLCAANVVNAYVNQCNHSGNKFSTRQLNRMFQAKRQMFDCIRALAASHSPHVRIATSTLPAVLVNIRVEKKEYQISFRGMTPDVLHDIQATGVNRFGHFEGYYLQPIATALYMYSYMLRWRGLDT